MSTTELLQNSTQTGFAPATPSSVDASGRRTLQPLLRFVRGRMQQRLQGIESGRLRVTDSAGTTEFGDSESAEAVINWQISDPSFYRLLLSDGSMGFAESYLRGHWQTDDLTGLLQLLYRDLERKSPIPGLLASVMGRGRQLLSRLTGNTTSQSKRQIAAHYDLSNDFFELFLDSTWMYSSAWFESEKTSLHDASVAKLDRVCRKLELTANDEVLEIGTGWGGFSLHAVENYGPKVTTTTISDAQFAKAEERFRDAGISDQVNLLNQDYRALTGQFDKLVSIEMVEAVGQRNLDE